MTLSAALVGVRVALCCTGPQAISSPRYWLPNRRKWFRRNVEGPLEAVARRRYTLQGFAEVQILHNRRMQGPNSS
jgi:hypothetical protein